MRTIIAFCALALSITSLDCTDNGAAAADIQGPFSSIYVTREGGGQKYYFVEPLEKYSGLRFTVIREDYHDTSYVKEWVIRDGGRIANYVRSILHGDCVLTGNLGPIPVLPNGTWVTYYAVGPGGHLLKITNPDVYQTLSMILM